MSYVPSAELVAVAWLKNIFSPTFDNIATNLPGDNTTWSDDGFIQVGVVGGSPGVHVPMRNPVIQVDCWACNLNSQKPPWGKASALAETIVEALYDPESVGEALTMPGTPGMYLRARVLSAYAVSEPRRLTLGRQTTPEDSATGFARLQFDMSMHWTAIPA